VKILPWNTPGFTGNTCPIQFADIDESVEGLGVGCFLDGDEQAETVARIIINKLGLDHERVSGL
jgi:hypothetical protein